MIRQRVAASIASRRQRRTSSGVPPSPSLSVESAAANSAGQAESSFSSSDEDEDRREAKGGGGGGDKPWMKIDSSVYEEQLEQLQEQLVQVMLENQQLQGELEEQKKKPGGSQRRELEQLKQENASLHHRITQSLSSSTITTSTSTITTSSSPPNDRTTSHRTHSSNSDSEAAECGFESLTNDRERVVKERLKRRLSSHRFSYASLRESMYNTLSLFSEEVRTGGEEEEEEATPLTAKKLKDNVTRLGKSSKPWRDMATHGQDILRWRNSAESLVVFLIYMYCVWNGWLLQFILFISIIKLSLNYLYISGLAEQFGLTQGQSEEEAEESMGLADKFVLVKQVAQTVQNTSGVLSDSLEKLRNLVLWRQPEATRKLYTALFGFLVLSLFLPNSYTFTLIGLGMGIKLFIVDNIYRKYPRVQEEFDDVNRMWKSLPTDAQLQERQTLTHDEMRSLFRRRSSALSTDSGWGGDGGGGGGGGGRDSRSSSSHHISEEDAGFCSRFDLPTSEVPFPDWQGGRRCTLIDRERPLLGSKNGRLFLTYSFLCFERSSRGRESDRIILPLSHIATIEKAKPFAVLPGNGMAIEVSLQTNEKYMFGAILNRDQVLRSVLEQGLMLGLPWGADPDELSGQNHTPSSSTTTTTTTNNNNNNNESTTNSQ